MSALFPMRADPPWCGRGRPPVARNALLAQVRQEGPASIRDLAAALGKRVHHLRVQLAWLQNAGLVRVEEEKWYPVEVSRG